MAYPLQSMLKIRSLREDRAASELTRARHAREMAQEVRDEREKAYETWYVTKEARRDRVYEAVMGVPVSIDKLDQVRDLVRQIDEEGLLLAADKDKADQTLVQRTQEANASHVRYVEAEKNKEKIVLHQDVWLEEDRHEQERLADAEMEEFTGKRSEYDD